MHCTCRSLLTGAFSAVAQRPTAAAPLAFLVPSLFTSSIQTASFSVSAPLAKRKKRDRNPWRGVSALRHTGVSKKLANKLRLIVDVENLPKPVLDPEFRSKVEVDEDHGLWGFFGDKRRALTPPLEVIEHGRGWTVPELRNKDWDDLHRLWWVCVKEKNRIATESRERSRLGKMYGEHEERDRIKEIKVTMKAIKHTLTERFYAWEHAREAAMNDPEVNLSADRRKKERAYMPKEEENPDLLMEASEASSENATDEAASRQAMSLPEATKVAPEARA